MVALHLFFIPLQSFVRNCKYFDMNQYQTVLTTLLDKMASYCNETPSRGTMDRLRGLVGDICEVTEIMACDVLETLRHEAVLGIDDDINYADVSRQILSMRLSPKSPGLEELTTQANERLTALSTVLTAIDRELKRPHQNVEFVRLYERERDLFLTPEKIEEIRAKYDGWINEGCYGSPTIRDYREYITERLVHLLEKGLFQKRANHIQKADAVGEFDFDHLPSDHPLKHTVYKHYAALRQLVDYADGDLVVRPCRVGQFLYQNRHDKVVTAHRQELLRYLYMIGLAQEDRRALKAELARETEAERLRQEALRQEAEAEQQRLAAAGETNYYAPALHLKLLLHKPWFATLVTDRQRFDAAWVDTFVEALMASEWRDAIAADWAVSDKRLMLKCMIVGVLKDAGVIKGSYNAISKVLDIDSGKPSATLAEYLGKGKKQPFADWIINYVES